MVCPAKKRLSWGACDAGCNTAFIRADTPHRSGRMMSGQGQQSAFARPVRAKWRINLGAENFHERRGVTTSDAPVSRADERDDDVRVSKR